MITVEDALSRGHGVERQFHCPVHEDRNASASVNALSGLWICYACGAKGKVDLDKVEIDPETISREMRKLTALVENERRVYAEDWLDTFDATGPGEYWLSRFSEATCRYFRLGEVVDDDGYWATYPMRDNVGQVLGIVRRTLDDQGPKYKYPYGLDMTDYLFNYHGCSGDILVLTEGATDAMAAWEAGYTDAMAVYGSRLSKKQRQSLRRYGPKALLLAFDNDDAGERAVRTYTDAFPEVVVERVTWPEQYKDLASMPVALRQTALDVARVFAVRRLTTADAISEADRALARSRSEQVVSEACGSNERTTPKRLSIKRSRTSETPRQPRPKLRLV